MKTSITNHVYLPFINVNDTSEQFQIREAIRLQTKTDWRALGKKDKLDAKSKKLLAELKREANKNFNNETVVRYMSY